MAEYLCIWGLLMSEERFASVLPYILSKDSDGTYERFLRENPMPTRRVSDDERKVYIKKKFI